MAAAGEFGFRGDEVTFNSGFEDDGLIALEIGFHALQVGDGFIEAGELLFNFGNDSALIINRWQGNIRSLKERRGNALLSNRARHVMSGLGAKLAARHEMIDVMRIDTFARTQHLKLG